MFSFYGYLKLDSTFAKTINLNIPGTVVLENKKTINYILIKDKHFYTKLNFVSFDQVFIEHFYLFFKRF